jgi:FkbM family methyltransferase
MKILKKMTVKTRKLLFALRYRWNGTEFFWVLLKVMDSFSRLSFFSDNSFRKKVNRCFTNKWLKTEHGETFYDFCGAKICFVDDQKLTSAMKQVFDDVFIVPCRFADNHQKETVEYVDFFTAEGPYGYIDGEFDVSVKKSDTVIDAGAWLGDFSAYAAQKGATVYAFEPEKRIFEILNLTAKLNPEGKIIPVQKGLSANSGKASFYVNGSLSHSVIPSENSEPEEIELITIDDFVRENSLRQVDFIKSDIEGDERNMLLGARKTLQKYAPKLALCTYHLPDDKEVMTKIILEANPNYTIKYLRHKLFAAVLNR